VPIYFLLVGLPADFYAGFLISPRRMHLTGGHRQKRVRINTGANSSPCAACAQSSTSSNPVAGPSFSCRHLYACYFLIIKKEFLVVNKNIVDSRKSRLFSTPQVKIEAFLSAIAQFLRVLPLFNRPVQVSLTRIAG
jgi:hypothetical protein